MKLLIIQKGSTVFKILKRILILYRYLKALLFRCDYNYDCLPKKKIDSIIDIYEKGYHCYFGYYDKSPINDSGDKILYLKTSVKETNQAFICVYDLRAESKRVLATTNIWNTQQGCMLQWISNNSISYNIYNEQNQEYQTVQLNVDTMDTIFFPRAAYSYSNDFSSFLSLNFYRLELYAAGYGYKFNESLSLMDDGIWEVSAQKGVELLVNLERIVSFRPHYDENLKHYVNHLSYCPDSRRIIFIHRWLDKANYFKSRLLIYNKDCDELKVLLDNGHVSHFCWKSEKELLIYATNNDGYSGYFILNIDDGESCCISSLPKEDGHPSFSYDYRYVVTDTYPNNLRNQFLFVYDMPERRLYLIDRLYSPMKYFDEQRCDLHPRWGKRNNTIFVDTTCKGERMLRMYKVNL